MTSPDKRQEALLDELLKDYSDQKDILGEQGVTFRAKWRAFFRIIWRILFTRLSLKLIPNNGFRPRAVVRPAI